MMNFGEKRKSGCYKGKSPINQRKEEPKFILKSHYNNQQSNQQMEHNSSYLQLYKEQRKKDVSPDQSVSSKLQQILQKQINNKGIQQKNRFKTQNTSNNSIDMSRQQQKNVFNSKPRSVDMINLNNESYNMDYSNQMNRLHMIKKDDSTESKQKIMGKLSMLASEMPTPNLINQITFNDQDLNEEFKFVNEQKQIEELQNENLQLTSKKQLLSKYQLANIKKINLALQQQIQGNRQLQGQLDKFNLMKDQYENVLRQKDDMINDLRHTIIELQQQLEYNDNNKSKGQLQSNTSREIDQIKNRILARKSTHRSSKEMLSNNDILNEIDSSARKELKYKRSQKIPTLKLDADEDKENSHHISNSYNPLF